MVVFTLACIGGSLFIDRYPRRHLVLGSGALATLFISLFVVCSALTHLDWRIKYVAVAVIYAYAVVFGTVLGPISWFVAPELGMQSSTSSRLQHVDFSHSTTSQHSVLCVLWIEQCKRDIEQSSSPFNVF